MKLQTECLTLITGEKNRLANRVFFFSFLQIAHMFRRQCNRTNKTYYRHALTLRILPIQVNEASCRCALVRAIDSTGRPTHVIRNGYRMATQ